MKLKLMVSTLALLLVALPPMVHAVDKEKKFKFFEAVDFLKAFPANKINVPGGSKNNFPDFSFEELLRSLDGSRVIKWEYGGCVGREPDEDACVVTEVIVSTKERDCPDDELIFRLMPRKIQGRKQVNREPILFFEEDADVYLINDEDLGVAERVRKFLWH